MSKPRLLDLYSGAGGATAGYQRAGFKVTGVDINPMPNYCGDKFVQGDAVEYVLKYGHRFDFIHASPPCQRYSAMSTARPGLADTYPDLIEPTRQALNKVNQPWIIENVIGAPMRQDLLLCGTMFDQPLYRHRQFEFSFHYLEQPEHPAHTVPASRAGHWVPGTIMSVAGHMAPIAHARKIMDMNWTNRHELAESIPPFYTEFIGKQIIGGL